MEHQYKSQLAENLKMHYANRGWKISTAFAERDEIKFILPSGSNAKNEKDNLYSVLETLPEIDLPKERVRILFWVEHEPMHNCQIEIINPDIEDYKIYAIGSDAFLTLDEYNKYLKKH